MVATPSDMVFREKWRSFGHNSTVKRFNRFLCRAAGDFNGAGFRRHDGFAWRGGSRCRWAEVLIPLVGSRAVSGWSGCGRGVLAADLPLRFGRRCASAGAAETGGGGAAVDRFGLFSFPAAPREPRQADGSDSGHRLRPHRPVRHGLVDLPDHPLGRGRQPGRRRTIGQPLTEPVGRRQRDKR
jgi:hypothetical protein